MTNKIQVLLITEKIDKFQKPFSNYTSSNMVYILGKKRLTI